MARLGCLVLGCHRLTAIHPECRNPSSFLPQLKEVFRVGGGYSHRLIVIRRIDLMYVDDVPIWAIKTDVETVIGHRVTMTPNGHEHFQLCQRSLLTKVKVL